MSVTLRGLDVSMHEKFKNRVLLGANPSLVINAISGYIHLKRYV